MRKTKNGTKVRKIRAIRPMKKRGEKRPGRTSAVDGRTRRKAVRIAKETNPAEAARQTGMTYSQVRYALKRAA